MLHKHIESHCDSVGGKLDRALPLATAASTAVRAFTVPRIGRVIWLQNKQQSLEEKQNNQIADVTLEPCLCQRHISTAVNVFETCKQGQKSSILHILMLLMNVLSVGGGEWAIFMQK